MSISSIVALFWAMIVLAILPSPSVFLVVARSIASGFVQGAAIALGIVLGDVVFILFALYGLAAIAEILDSIFVWVNYLGATYLLWLGVMLWRAQVATIDLEGRQETTWLANLLCGFLITIGDPKAVAFYMSFFPAFINLAALSMQDTVMILAIAVVSVGGAKLFYAGLADQSRQFFRNPRAQSMMNRMAGTVMILTGIVLVMKT